MSKVICINSEGLPQGAEVVKDQEYEVLKHFRNALDQNVYIIKGVNNEGTTKMGMNWFIIGMVQREETYLLSDNTRINFFSEGGYINQFHIKNISWMN